ncbi:MAG: hypothetical protein ACM3SR_11715 [Ignavibacteriales bacterium]
MTKQFDDWDIKDLADSGLTPENFTVDPLRSEAELEARLGFTSIGNISIIDIGGYWIPYPNVPKYYRLKLREKIGDAKYLSPKDKGNHAYILPEVQEIAKDYKPDRALFLLKAKRRPLKPLLRDSQPSD